MKPVTLEEAYGAFLDLLHSTGKHHLVIGGLAVGMLGEARLTQDLDFLLFLKPSELLHFLRQAKHRGFTFSLREVQWQVAETGTFRLTYRGIPVDCLVASTPLEDQMWRRSKKLRLHHRVAHFPSPEDLILLKLLPGRPKDLLDMQGLFLRHRGRLDMGYLRETAQRMAEELQDHQILHRLRKLGVSVGAP